MCTGTALIPDPPADGLFSSYFVSGAGNRMRILYYSVHAILEYDEIRMLHRLGHEVLSLGVYFGATPVQDFRGAIEFSAAELDLHDKFHAMGCSFGYGAQAETVLTAEFVDLFDAIIVMHDIDLIQRLWPILSRRPVIWRTIGQGIDRADGVAGPLWADGLRIVRYSPVERRSPSYCGETALIRFCKDSSEYGPWTGHSEQILTFANFLQHRYPEECALYTQIVAGLPSALGGQGNEGLQGALGMLDPRAQKTHYDHCRGYLYCSGKEVPYTLNLMEAMMTGLPIVGYAFPDAGPYYEVPDLLRSGGGLVASSVGEARDYLTTLLAEHSFAADVGAKGRARAIELFGSETIDAQWREVLDRL